MTNDDLTLQKIAQSVLDKHQVSGRELSRIADRKGLVLSHTTINGLAAGTYKSRPTAKTLAAMAHLSDYTVEQVYAAAGLPVPLRPLAEDLPPDADTLSAEQRQAVLAVVRQFASANRALARLEQEQANGSQAQGTPISRAAGSAAHNNEANVVDLPIAAHPMTGAQSAGRRQARDQDEQGES